MTVDLLLDEGFGLDVEAHWGAGFLPGRYVPGTPSWTWPELVAPHLTGINALLDLGTGEGGILADLPGLPPFTVAAEEWLPTVPAAAKTLAPKGIRLVVCGGGQDNTNPDGPRRVGLPFRDSSYDVVLPGTRPSNLPTYDACSNRAASSSLNRSAPTKRPRSGPCAGSKRR